MFGRFHRIRGNFLFNILNYNVISGSIGDGITAGSVHSDYDEQGIIGRFRRIRREFSIE